MSEFTLENTNIEEEIEDSAISIISQFIEMRKGQKITDLNQLFTFIAVICSNAARLERVDYANMSLEEKVNIAVYLFSYIYEELKEAGMISSNLISRIRSLSQRIDKLREQIELAIIAYDLTAELIDLPSFKEIKKSGVNAITRKVDRILKK